MAKRSNSKPPAAEIESAVLHCVAEVERGLPDPDSLAAHIVDRFGPSGRIELLRNLQRRYRGAEPRKELAGAIPLWTRLCKDIPSNQAPRSYAVAVQAARQLFGTEIAAAITHNLLLVHTASAKNATVLTSEQVQSFSRSVEGMGELLAISLERQRNAGSTDHNFLDKWATALTPLIGHRAKGSGISPEDAKRIVDALAHVHVGEFPDVLFLAYPRLVALADSKNFGTFLGSEIGAMICPGATSVASSSSSVERNPKLVEHESITSPEAPYRDLPDRERSLLKGIEEYLRERTKRDADRLKHLDEAHQQLRAARDREASLGQQLGFARSTAENDKQRLDTQIGEMRKSLAQLESALRSAESEAEKWRKEISLQEAGASGQIELERSRSVDHLRQLISRPTRTVRDHVRAILDSSPADRRIHRLALAFDNLHRGILKALNEPESERLPRELLTTTDGDAEAHAG